MPPRVQLCLADSAETAWGGAARPWFERAAAAAWRSPRPCAALVPSRAYAQYLKLSLAQAGLSLAGLHFWTPGDLRGALRAGLPDPPPVAVREHLHLLLALGAAGAEAGPTARSVARDPARLLRTLDLLAAAGLGAAAIAFPPAVSLAEGLRRRLAGLGWSTVQELDWRLAAQPPAGALGHLLVAGFDGAHWDLWPLLQAAVGAAEQATVILGRPRLKAEQIDQAWIGSWEQAHGAAAPLASAPAARPFAPLAERMENPEAAPAGAAPPVDLLIGRTLKDQAEAIAARLAAWLAEEDAARLGVLFPGPGALGREVSARLVARGIVHYDGLGHAPPPSEDERRWAAWIAFQREPRLQSWLDLRALAPAALDAPGLDRALDRALSHVLVDDLDVLRAWLGRSRGEAERLAGEALGRVAALPGQAPLAQHLERTRASLRGLGWADAARELERPQRDIAPLAGEAAGRSLFLDWLQAAVLRPGRARDPQASNPFARVQLLPYHQAENLPWSHLILADLNDGCWPPPFDQPGFLSEAQVAVLNRDAVEQGRQGEGHWTAKAGRGLLLGAAERRALVRRQFYNLVESAGCAVAAAASREDVEGGRPLAPGDFLLHLYYAQHGEPLTEARVAALGEATADWTALQRPAAGAVAAEPSSAAQTRTAYDARRAPAAFGPYEFALARPPAEPLALACKTWEAALANPAGIWLEQVLGVRPAPDGGDGDRRLLARGTWVHAWLGESLGGARQADFAERPSGPGLAAALRRAAAVTRERAQASFRSAGRTLPDWWLAVWADADWLARQLAGRLDGVAGWPFAAAERRLPDALAAPLGGGAALRLRGRMDLVLAQAAAPGPGAAQWVLDFKTGADKPLKAGGLAGRLARGEGVQLALYVLALRAAGAGAVAGTLLTPYAEAAPQVDAAEVEAQAPFWRGLCRLQDTGIFGQRGELRPEFGRDPGLPLATLPVDPDVLEEKWALTHPLLVNSELPQKGAKSTKGEEA